MGNNSCSWLPKIAPAPGLSRCQDEEQIPLTQQESPRQPSEQALASVSIPWRSQDSTRYFGVLWDKWGGKKREIGDCRNFFIQVPPFCCWRKCHPCHLQCAEDWNFFLPCGRKKLSKIHALGCETRGVQPSSCLLLCIEARELVLQSLKGKQEMPSWSQLQNFRSVLQAHAKDRQNCNKVRTQSADPPQEPGTLGNQSPSYLHSTSIC